MKVCLVCGSALLPQAPQCPKCATEAEVLGQLERISRQLRFLFGRVKSIAGPPGPPLQATKKAAARGESKKKSRPAAKTESVVKISAPFTAEETDTIRNRDPGFPLRMPSTDPFYIRFGAYSLDILFCIVLNLWIFRLILWFSHRNFSALVTFSLIPLLFVALSFSGLYFWLFLGLFKKTLGYLVMDGLFKGGRSQTKA